MDICFPRDNGMNIRKEIVKAVAILRDLDQILDRSWNLGNI